MINHFQIKSIRIARLLWKSEYPRQRASRESIIIRLARLGWTQAEIADTVGVIRQRVSQIANIADFGNFSNLLAQGRDMAYIADLNSMDLARLGWTQAEIAQAVGLDQSVISRIMQNAEIGNLHNLLAQGRDMAYIADLNSMDLALAWALRLDGKTDQERFSKEELNWGLRTWDMWNFNDCDSRFGDDWPGRIPAQLVAHTLFYFTNQGDLAADRWRRRAGHAWRRVPGGVRGSRGTS